MRRFIGVLIAICILLTLTVHALGEAVLSIDNVENEIRPGKATLIGFVLPSEGAYSLTLNNKDGELLSVVIEHGEGLAGQNYIWWNGSYNGVMAPSGEAILTLTFGAQQANSAVTVGKPAPFITSVSAEPTALSPEQPSMTVHFMPSDEGYVQCWLTALGENGDETEIRDWLVEATRDEQTLVYDISEDHLTDGNYSLSFCLVTHTDASEEISIPFSVTGFAAAGEILHEEDLSDDTTDALPLNEDLMREVPPEGEDTVDAITADSNHAFDTETMTEVPPVGEDTVDAGTLPESAKPLIEMLPDGEDTVPAVDENDLDDTVAPSSETALEDTAEDDTADENLTDTAILEEDTADDDTIVYEEHVMLDDDSEKAHGVALLDGNDQKQYTPSYGSPYSKPDEGMNYWTLPMDITDEEKVWEMLMQPMTVLDIGGKNAQRAQVTIRSDPHESAEGVGVVTCVSQGVHVLAQQGDWTLIECYSSSFHDSKVKAWNKLVQGWVPTKYIKTVKPDTKMGIVVDKLTQRLYLFMDGKLSATLLVSTGLPNPKQPYNETRSGEFIIVSAVGTFNSDNLVCSYALRYNSGDLLHEVPYIKGRDGTKNYASAEKKLGTRASHGCIRTQRKTYPNGINMRWLWDNRRMNTKLVIWEDWQGRQIVPPSDDTLLYYNPKGGNAYHSHETCYSAKGKTFEPFTYGELEHEEYKKLERCTFCTPPLRLSEIEEINKDYYPGGDHQPVITEAWAKLGLD